MGRGNDAALCGGLPTGAQPCLVARRRCRPPPMPVFVFRAERRVADKFGSHHVRNPRLTSYPPFDRLFTSEFRRGVYRANG